MPFASVQGYPQTRNRNKKSGNDEKRIPPVPIDFCLRTRNPGSCPALVRSRGGRHWWHAFAPAAVRFKRCPWQSPERAKTATLTKTLAAPSLNKGPNSRGSPHSDGALAAAAPVHEAKLLDAQQPPRKARSHARNLHCEVVTSSS